MHKFELDKWKWGYGTHLDSDAGARRLDEADDFFPGLVVDGDAVHLDQPVTGQEASLVVVLHDGAGLGEYHCFGPLSKEAHDFYFKVNSRQTNIGIVSHSSAATYHGDTLRRLLSLNNYCTSERKSKIASGRRLPLDG